MFDEPKSHSECQSEHGDLADLHAEVETDQRLDHLALGEIQFLHHRCESHAVQKSQCEHQTHAPGFELLHPEVFDPDVSDADRYHRLDDV